MSRGFRAIQRYRIYWLTGDEDTSLAIWKRTQTFSKVETHLPGSQPKNWHFHSIVQLQHRLFCHIVVQFSRILSKCCTTRTRRQWETNRFLNVILVFARLFCCPKCRNYFMRHIVFHCYQMVLDRTSLHCQASIEWDRLIYTQNTEASFKKSR